MPATIVANAAVGPEMIVIVTSIINKKKGVENKELNEKADTTLLNENTETEETAVCEIK